MRLSVQTDYALRMLMFLASQDGQHAIADIAASYRISKNHLMKVSQKLVADGLVISVRGRGGGLILGHPASAINLGQVVRLMEDVGAFVECFNASANRCVVTRHCGLRNALAGGVEAFMHHLDQFTIADLIGNGEVFRSQFVQARR